MVKNFKERLTHNLQLNCEVHWIKQNAYLPFKTLRNLHCSHLLRYKGWWVNFWCPHKRVRIPGWMTVTFRRHFLWGGSALGRWTDSLPAASALACCQHDVSPYLLLWEVSVLGSKFNAAKCPFVLYLIFQMIVFPEQQQHCGLPQTSENVSAAVPSHRAYLICSLGGSDR